MCQSINLLFEKGEVLNFICAGEGFTPFFAILTSCALLDDLNELKHLIEAYKQLA